MDRTHPLATMADLHGNTNSGLICTFLPTVTHRGLDSIDYNLKALENKLDTYTYNIEFALVVCSVSRSSVKGCVFSSY